MKYLASDSPSAVARNSSTYAPSSLDASEGNGKPSKEERDGGLQDVRELLKPAGAEAIDAVLVFLHLLEANSKGGAEPGSSRASF
jgi:hypothetical protein